MIKLLYTLFFFSIFALDMQAQIELKNPSFEGIRAEAKVPNGWEACGHYSTPDILPGFWNVNDAPNDGNSYIGLISREDNTWEYIGQRLPSSMEKGECYTFSIFLANSSFYTGYNQPLRLRIWGASTFCGKQQLLGETTLVKHNNWKEYVFYFFPKKNLNFIILEAYYDDEAEFPYRGNLLLDNCSVIETCIRADLLEPAPVETNCNEG